MLPVRGLKNIDQSLDFMRTTFSLTKQEAVQMKLLALSALVLVLNGLWDEFNPQEKEQLVQDSSTWPQELQEKVQDLLDGLENKS